MSFQYPYALLVLIAIPILILIYILKNKYKEETEPSTYIWELSEKFLKRKNPLHKFEHLLSLIVQIVTITGLAFSLAHPVFTLKGQSDNIAFVLDASASMKTKDEKSDKTYFDLAKDEIFEQAKQAAKGSSFSLIYSSNEPRVVCQNIKDLDQLSVFLDSLTVSSSTGSLTDSIGEVQKMFSSGTANKCILATDKNIKAENAQNVTVLSVGKAVENYAIIDCNYSYETKDGEDGTTGNYLVITTRVISYVSDVKLKLQFNYGADDNRKLIGGQQYVYNVKAGAETSLVTEVLNQNKLYDSLPSFTARITNEDALMDDNVYIIYDKTDNSTTSVRLYSSNPFYFKSAFNSFTSSGIKKIKLDVYEPSRYQPDDTFSGVYIFDNFSPSVLPEKGTFWFFGSPTTVEGSGFIAQNSTSDSASSYNGVFTNNTDSLLYTQFTNECKVDDSILIKKYIRYSFTDDFTTILKDEDPSRNAPLIFGGKNSNGNKEVVFAFDVHDSNLPLKYNFLALLKNFLDYSNPDLITKFDYEINDTLSMFVPDESKNFTVTTPSKNKEYIDVNSDGVASYDLEEAGIYEFHLEYEDSTLNKDIKVFVSFPISESNSSQKEDTDNLSLIITDNVEKGDGIFDNILPIVIVAAVFFILDWGLYVYEQY